MFPETVGRSLEEVEEIFQQGHTFSAWKIGKDIGKKTLAEVVEKSKDISVSQSTFENCGLPFYPTGTNYAYRIRKALNLLTRNTLIRLRHE